MEAADAGGSAVGVDAAALAFDGRKLLMLLLLVGGWRSPMPLILWRWMEIVDAGGQEEQRSPWKYLLHLAPRIGVRKGSREAEGRVAADTVGGRTPSGEIGGAPQRPEGKGSV